MGTENKRKIGWGMIGSILAGIATVITIFFLVLDKKIEFVEGPLKLKIATLEKDINELERNLRDCRSKLEINPAIDTIPKIEGGHVKTDVPSIGFGESINRTYTPGSNGDWKKEIKNNLGIFFNLFEVEFNDIEKKGNDLIITISCRNIDERSNQVYIEKEFITNTKLLNEQSGKEYFVKKITGASAKATSIIPNEKLFIHYIFENPKGEKQLSFLTTLKSPRARGKAIFINEPIQLVN